MLAPVPRIEPRIEWRVGMHAPGLHTYPLLTQWLVRFVYFVTGYQVTAHDVGIAEDEAQAREWLKDKNYFAKPLYVGIPLGEDGQGPGPVIWGDEDVNGLYAKHSPDLVTLTRGEFEALRGAVDGICRTAHAR